MDEEKLLQKLKADIAPLTIEFESGRWSVLEDNTVLWSTELINATANCYKYVETRQLVGFLGTIPSDNHNPSLTFAGRPRFFGAAPPAFCPTHGP